MSQPVSSSDNSYGEFLLRHRFVALFILLLATFGLSSGAQFLYFDNDYRVFFGKDNPQLKAFEKVQQTYTKIDNVNFAIDPLTGSANDPAVLAGVEALTEMAWQLPFSIRVDSLSNYQHTEVDGDDLIVRDLFMNGSELSADEMQLVNEISTTEPSLSGKIHDSQHRACLLYTSPSPRDS